MPLIRWRDDFSVGIAAFNEQHKGLIGLINRLYDAMMEGRGREVMNGIFRELVDYTVRHFAAEEEQMRTHAYPGLDDHAEEHRKLTAKALDLKSRFESGNMFVTVETLEFLKEWITNHILKTDKEYGPFLNGKGVH